MAKLYAVFALGTLLRHIPQLMPVFTNISAYKFAPLGDLKTLQTALRTMCVEAGMRGTILLSPEGINVVVSTKPDAAIGLVTYLRTIPGLASLTAKISERDRQPFMVW